MRFWATYGYPFVATACGQSGARIPNAAILHLRIHLPASVLLIFDQANRAFNGQPATPIFALAGRGDTVVLRPFSTA